MKEAGGRTGRWGSQPPEESKEGKDIFGKLLEVAAESRAAQHTQRHLCTYRSRGGSNRGVHPQGPGQSSPETAS